MYGEGAFMHKRIPVLAIGGILAIGGLSGCGSSHAASLSVLHHQRPHHRSTSHHHLAAQVYVPKPTSIPVNTSPGKAIEVTGTSTIGVPHIMQISMQSLPSMLKNYALVPMEIPWPTNSSKIMYYNPVVTPPNMELGLTSGYSVTLTALLGTVASFSTDLYGNSTQAAAAVMSPLIEAHVTFPRSAVGVVTSIGSGITAQSLMEDGLHLLAWREGQWSIVVAGATSSPLSISEEVAAYLHVNYLPAPAPEGTGVGTILVSDTSKGITSTTAWQENQVAYEVSTYPATAHTVDEDLSLVVGMKKYSS